MKAIVTWFELLVSSIPLPLLEVWGRFAYIVGLFLAICAFGGFTFRIGERWGFGRVAADVGREGVPEPAADVRADHRGRLHRIVHRAGPGRADVRVPEGSRRAAGIVLLGYPALITVPFAYGLSDLIEGVPPEFLLAWLPGYFINPACFWIAHQFIGKNPDFRMPRTWGRYLVGRRPVHDAGAGVVGICVLGSVPLGDFVSQHHVGAVLHDVDHLGHWARSHFWSRCRWRDGSDGSGRRFPDASRNARSAARCGPGNRAAARRREAPIRFRRACRSGSSSSRRSSHWCW